MKAAVTISKEVIEFHDHAEPQVMPGHAIVRVRALTLCGTDLHIWEDDYATELPIIQGHEFAGIIEALPDDGGGFTVGDRVAVSPMFYCGTCYACRIGRVNACEEMSVYGCYEDGALVELMNVPLEKLYAIPASLPMDLAPLCEPVSIAMQAVNRGRPIAGEKALVLGSGPIGLLATLYLTELGVDVIAADTVQSRCDFAKAFGATDTILIDPTVAFPSASHKATLEAWSNSEGPSFVLEATGMPSSLQNAVEVVTTAGRVVLVGISEREVSLSMRTIPIKEIDLIGSRNSENLIAESLALLDRHQDVARALITHRFDFLDVPNAFETLRSSTEMVGKVLIEMPGA
ncbi:MAG: hypothetical protein JWP30_1677 [Homoserinimonas sp.]|jgi:L-gulonate 5-dehydrogenase|nr:hypothetical protein [Homoserinimonas sp.]